MRLLFAVTAVLAGLASAQRGGPGPRGGNNQQGGQQQGGRFQGRGGGPGPGNLDMCQSIKDENTCELADAGCKWGPIPEGARRGPGSGFGSGKGGPRDGQGRRRLTERRGGRQGPQDSGRGPPMRVGCYSECFEIEEEEACSGTCRWSTGMGPQSGSGRGGRFGGGGRRRLQRNRNQPRDSRRDGPGPRGSGSGGRTPKCVPMAARVDTGLEVLVKIYTDQQCTELFQPTEDQNEEPNTACRGRNEEDCGKSERCVWGEGNDRFSDPHCLPKFLVGSGRGSGSGRFGGRGGPFNSGGNGRRRLQQPPRGGNQRNREEEQRQGERQGRGQDFDDRGRGGNRDQNRRLTTNTITRMIPVIDDRGQPKCSFDTRGPKDVKQVAQFRKTTCVVPNQLNTKVYDDVLCTKLSDYGDKIPVIQRGVCMPLPQPGDRFRGSGSGSGRQSGRGRGRRRLEDERRDAKDLLDPDKCDGEWDTEMNFNTLVDWINELTCLLDDDSEEDEEPNERNPCNGLEREDCLKMDACDLQRNVCVWNKAPENRRNLYAIYEWRYLTKDGEETEEEFCYRGDEIADQDDYNYFCKGLESEKVCKAYGCKSFKNDKCNPQKKSVKCKKLGKGILDKKKMERDEYNKDLQKICDKYGAYGKDEGNRCTFNAKKGKCEGKVMLKQK